MQCFIAILTALLCVKISVAQTTLTSLPGAYRWGGVSTDAALGKYIIAAQTSVASKTVYDGKIYYSTNYGKSFIASNAPGIGYIDLAASVDNKVAVAVSNTEVFISLNYGVSWSSGTSAFAAVQAATNNNGQYIVTMSSGQINCLRVSADSGASWTGTFGPNLNSGSCTGVGMDGSGSTVLLGVAGSGLYFSKRSSTNSWSTPKLSYPSIASFQTIAYGGGTFYAGQTSSPYYIMRTTNLGSTWAIAGLSKSYAFDTSSMILSNMRVDNATGQTFIAIIGGDLFYSSNLGDSATQISIGVYTEVCTMTNNGTVGYWNQGSNPLTSMVKGDPSAMAVDTTTTTTSGGSAGILITIIVIVVVCGCIGILCGIGFIFCRAACLATICIYSSMTAQPQQPMGAMQEYPPAYGNSAAPVYVQSSAPPAYYGQQQPVYVQSTAPPGYYGQPTPVNSEPIYGRPVQGDPKVINIAV